MSFAMPPTESSAFPILSLSLRFDNTLGVLLIGEILSAILFGVTSVQIYLYYGRCQRDGSAMKRVISLLWILDATHLAFTSHSVYHYTVSNFMNPLELFYCPWSFAADMILGNLSQIIVASVFAIRIWRLSRKLWILLFIIPPMLFTSGSAISIAVLVRKFPLYTDFIARYAWLWHATLATCALCDCAIASSLCTILIKKRTGFKGTDSLIRTLILYSISTCALTSSVAVASVITFAIMPRNFIFVTLAILLPKLTLNSLLALLNSRDFMLEKNVAPVSIHLSRLKAGVEAPRQRCDKEQILDIGVQSSNATGTTFDAQCGDV